MMSMGIPLRPSRASAWLPDRHKVSGQTGDYTLSVLTAKDDTVRRFTAPAPTVSITEAQRDSIFEAEIAGIDKDWEASVREIAKPSQLPTTWPKWSGIAVDRASRIWVARPGAKGAASVLDVFSPDGILLGSVPSPHPKILEGYWTSSRVYLRDETVDGMPRIRVFRIDTTGTR